MINKLKIENANLRELLALAITDMAMIEKSIEDCNYFLCGKTDKVNGLKLGRCDCCTKSCHNSDNCNWQWKHADKLKELGIDLKQINEVMKNESCND